MRTLLALSVALLLVLLWLGFGWSGPPELLTDVYSPTFDAIPPRASITDSLARWRDDLRSPRGQTFLQRVVPDQAGVLWLTLILGLAVAVDFSRLRNPHNLELALMLAPAFVFFDVLEFLNVLREPAYFTLLDAVFSVVFVATLALIVRALRRAVTPIRWAWQPNLPLGVLATLAGVLLACNIMTALVRVPDDAGYFVNLGAQRLRERGRLPYGDPLLTGTPAAAYGPVLYAAHVPFQLAVAPRPLNERSTSRPPLAQDSSYYLPPPLATKLCTIFFQLVAVAALFACAVRLSGRRDVGWAMVALYCGSPYVLGVGGRDYFIGGMTFVSHLGPAALTLAAFALLGRPIWSGALLALATGAGFYPAFIFPAWAAHWWRDWRGLQRFVAGFAVVAFLIAAGTWIASRPADGQSRLGTILADTLGHHTDPGGYGSSPFGFWGQRGGIRAWAIAPLVGRSSLTSPVFLALFALVGVTIAASRNRSDRALALSTAAIAAAFSLAKIHPSGSYVAWYYGFLLLGLFAADAPASGSEPRHGADVQLPHRA